MESYTDFASVYDLFMEETPYVEWKEVITQCLMEHGITDGIVLDLGCGTGSLTELLAEAGYDMIGIDASSEMLEIANQKRIANGSSVLYLQQDMREFELYGTVRAIVCVCDCLNYLEKSEEISQTFNLISNYLEPDGIFIFDMNTIYKYESVLGDCTIAENREEASFIWQNTYYEDERINEYEVTFFVKEQDGRYRRFTELHYQKAYEQEEIIELLSQAGLKVIEAVDGDSGEAVHTKTGRIRFTCIKKNT